MKVYHKPVTTENCSWIFLKQGVYTGLLTENVLRTNKGDFAELFLIEVLENVTMSTGVSCQEELNQHPRIGCAVHKLETKIAAM